MIACFSRSHSGLGPLDPGKHLLARPMMRANSSSRIRLSFPEIQYHADQPDAEAFWRDFDQVLWHQEQPFADASMVAHFSLMRLAKTTGVPVLLSG